MKTNPFNDRQTQVAYDALIKKLDAEQIRIFSAAIRELSKNFAPVTGDDLLDILHEMNQEALV